MGAAVTVKRWVSWEPGVPELTLAKPLVQFAEGYNCSCEVLAHAAPVKDSIGAFGISKTPLRRATNGGSAVTFRLPSWLSSGFHCSQGPFVEVVPLLLLQDDSDEEGDGDDEEGGDGSSDDAEVRACAAFRLPAWHVPAAVANPHMLFTRVLCSLLLLACVLCSNTIRLDYLPRQSRLLHFAIRHNLQMLVAAVLVVFCAVGPGWCAILLV